MFRGAVLHRNANFRGGIRHQQDVAGGAERRGADGAEDGKADVGWCVANAIACAICEIGCGNRFASHLGREIADPDEDQGFRYERGQTFHRDVSTASISGNGVRANAGRPASRQPPKASQISRTMGQRFAGYAGMG